MLRILADAIYLEYTTNILAAIITDFNSVTFTLSSSTVLFTVNKGWMLATVKWFAIEFLHLLHKLYWNRVA